MSFLKTFWKANQKHQKLSEELALQANKENSETEQTEEMAEDSIITFKLKYLGSTVVEKQAGDNISSEAVKNIIKTAKAGRKKFQRVNVNVSIEGISVCDLKGNDIFKVSIYRISNCSTDPTHKNIFSFISTDEKEVMECHAFLCEKRKMAETVTLTVAHAFNAAYEYWRLLPNTQEVQNLAQNLAKNALNVKTNAIEKTEMKIVEETKSEPHSPIDHDQEEILIDFDSDVKIQKNELFFNDFTKKCDFNDKWVCFDDDIMIPQRSAVF